eukprot:500792-Prymnesium_polylepis.2
MAPASPASPSGRIGARLIASRQPDRQQGCHNRSCCMLHPSCSSHFEATHPCYRDRDVICVNS